jgi:hypothetical protein
MSGLQMSWQQRRFDLERQCNLLQQEIEEKRVELQSKRMDLAEHMRERPATGHDRQEQREG